MAFTVRHGQGNAGTVLDNPFTSGKIVGTVWYASDRPHALGNRAEAGHKCEIAAGKWAPVTGNGKKRELRDCRCEITKGAQTHDENLFFL